MAELANEKKTCLSTNSDRSSDSCVGGSDSIRVLRIAVGTTNPCKIDAVKKAIKQSIGNNTASTTVDIHVEGFSVESGVPDQPFGDVS